jgi:hypothetical protein
MKHKWLYLLLFSAVLGQSSARGQNYSCTPHNRVAGPFHYVAAGYDEHITGAHAWANTSSSGCYYVATVYNNPNFVCATHAVASDTASAADYGELSTFLDIHEVNTATKQGNAWSNGPSVSADSEGAVAARSCWPSCGVAIGISGSGYGGGFSLSFPPDAIYSDAVHGLSSCQGNLHPVKQACYPNCTSPIVIAIKPHSDATKLFSNPEENCVTFDLKNDGHPQCYSWPKRHSGVGFLVYDRDGDGDVDKGVELFGTFTPGADGSCVGAKVEPQYANGFLALGCFDQPAHGGNRDLKISPKDQKWPKIKLWLPDHCWDAPTTACTSIPSELHTLAEFDIGALSVMYSPSQVEDRWGNQFKYYAQTNPKPHDLQLPDDELNERRMWDVWLVLRTRP